MNDHPLMVAAIAVSAYWSIVGLMALVKRIRSGRRVGMVPRAPLEKLMWIVWVPVIAGWIALPLIALDQDDAPWRLPAFALGDVWMLIRWIAAAGVAICLALTIVCWIRMGKNWAVAVVPGQEQPLVMTGPFRLARHPIYALSILMMLLTAVVLPHSIMIVVALIHVVFMNIKARHEEAFLIGQHGDAYRDYMRNVGRFLPRIG